MKTGNRKERLRPPLMIAFRQAFKNRNSKGDKPGATNAVTIVQSRRTVRTAISERELREDLSRDLESLLNTTNFESTIELGHLGQVRKSVLNYGIYDLVHRTSEDARSDDIARELKEAIMRYEPRIIADSLQIARDTTFSEDELKIRYSVKGDMDCDPAPAPVEFVANLEVASGKLALSRK